MKTMWTIAKREFTAYFTSPIAYVVLTVYLAVTNWFFFRGFFLIGQADLRSFFGLTPWIFLFFVPAIAMGKWAEERKLGTLEILFTLPICNRDIVLGKFLAGLAFVTVALGLTFPAALTASLVGPLDWGPVIGGYVGLLFLGGAYLAIGLFASSLTDNQIVAFILGVAGSFLLFFFGIASHFESVARGVLESRDIIYSLSLIGFFLFLNLEVFKGKTKNTPIVILTVLVALGVLNFVAARHSFRVDLTEDGQYTLAPATKTMLGDLDDVVTFRLYFTKDPPAELLSLKRDIYDLITEFKRAGGKQLQVEEQDPSLSPMDEQKAVLAGIPPLQVDVIKNDRREVAKVYLGMTIFYRDQQEVIPFVRNIGNLEYDLAQAILKVSTKETPKLGWLGETDGYTLVREQLGRRYELIDVAADKSGDIDIAKFSTLLLISPRAMNDAAVTAVDRFVAAGGKVIALVDRFEIGDGLVLTKVETPAVELLTRYGVTVDDGLVLDQANATASFASGMITYHLPYPYWPQVVRDGFAPDVPMVAELESLVLPWTSPLTVAESTEGRETTVLASTSSYGVVVSDEMQNLAPAEAGTLLRDGKKEVLPLVAQVHPASGATLLVVGTSRIIQDRFLQSFPANIVFFENAVDQLTQGDKLIGIRSRLNVGRPIAPLADNERQVLKVGNYGLGPFVVLVMGMVIFLVRRSRHRTLAAAYRS